MALGNNATFTAPSGELGRLPEEFRKQPAVPQGYELPLRSFHFGVSREGTVFHLQLSVTSDEIEISINAHNELRNHESGDAQQAARRFLQDRRTSESLVQHFFKVSVGYVNSDPEPT